MRPASLNPFLAPQERGLFARSLTLIEPPTTPLLKVRVIPMAHTNKNSQRGDLETLIIGRALYSRQSCLLLWQPLEFFVCFS